MLYFAYGSNMHPGQMQLRCADSEPLGIARLPGWRFMINGRGVATIVRDDDGLVCGVVWRLSSRDEDSLDGYEGVSQGLYQKTIMGVLTADQWLEALVYIATDHDCGVARTDYMDSVLSGAREMGLPSTYVEELAAWATTEG